MRAVYAIDAMVVLLALSGVAHAQPAATPTFPQTPQVQRPAPPPPIFDEKARLGDRLNEACAKAKAERTRVLVVIGTESRMFGQTLREVMATWDVSRETALEYQVVWAFAGETGEGRANRAVAKELGVEIAPDAEHASMIVLDDARKVIAQANFATMIDAIRKRVYGATKVLDFLQAHRAPQPVAQEKLETALARAKAEGKSVLLSFGTFGDGWSLRWRGVLTDPAARAAIEKVGVIADIELVRDKDAYALLEKYGGKSVQSTPWFALLDAEGKVLASSQTEKTPNIGFPSKDEEIELLWGLLGSGKGKLEPADKQAIRAALQRERDRP